MLDETPTSRRTFVKRSIVATGLVGGVLGSANTAAAADQTIEIEAGGNRSGGEYTFVVNDPDVSEERIEGDCSEIRSDSDSAIVSGCIDGDDTNVYSFQEQVTTVDLQGELSLSVFNPDGLNIGGELHVEGTYSDYYVKVTDDMDRKSNLESGDEIGDDYCRGSLGWSDDDYYEGEGTLSYVEAATSDGNSVTVRHDI